MFNHMIGAASKVALVSAIAMFVFQPSPARAILLLTAQQAVDATHTRTDTGTQSPPDEVAAIQATWNQYYAEHPPRAPSAFASGSLYPYIGQVEIADMFPVTTFNPGQTETLSFEFIDASTLLPTGGPAIGSVEFEVNTDASNPNVYALIGTSTDPTDNFPISYTFGNNEPTIVGIPFDLAGNPIIERDDDGVGNVAEGFAFNIPVPEPLTFTMFGAGLASAAAIRRRRKPKGA